MTSGVFLLFVLIALCVEHAIMLLILIGTITVAGITYLGYSTILAAITQVGPGYVLLCILLIPLIGGHLAHKHRKDKDPDPSLNKQ